MGSRYLDGYLCHIDSNSVPVVGNPVSDFRFYRGDPATVGRGLARDSAIVTFWLV